MTGRRSRRALILLAMIIGITVLHVSLPTGDRVDHALHVVLRGLYLVPILAAALWFEFPGAAVATGTVISAYALHIAVQWSGRPWENANQVGMIAVYAILGGSAGLLARREARLREQKAREEARLQREIVLKSLAGLS